MADWKMSDDYYFVSTPAQDDAEQAWQDLDAEENQVLYLREKQPILIRTEVVEPDVFVPAVVDVDPDLDPRVAVDLAVAEMMYHQLESEMTFSWREVRPRIVRRLNKQYGVEY